jgi:ABC-2 type transport system permease protein
MNFNRIKAIIARHLYNLRHNLDRLTDSFYWPAIDIVMWGLTSQYLQQADQPVNNLVLIILSGLIFWQVVWRSQYEISVNLLEELWSQNLVNLFATPLTVAEWIIGLFALGLINIVLSVSFAGVLAWLLYSINLLDFSWLLLVFFAGLLIMGWWTGLIVAGLIIVYGKNIQAFAWAGVFLLAPFSAIYFPLDSLPLWAQKIAQILPSSYIFEGMRYNIATGKIPWLNLGVSFSLNILYLAASCVFFQLCFRKSQQLGLSRLE